MGDGDESFGPGLTWQAVQVSDTEFGDHDVHVGAQRRDDGRVGNDAGLRAAAGCGGHGDDGSAAGGHAGRTHEVHGAADARNLP